jgi:hypothetical protein
MPVKVFPGLGPVTRLIGALLFRVTLLALAVVAVLPGRAADVSQYAVIKAISYRQTNAAGAFPRSSGGVSFSAAVVPSGPGTVLSATVTTPGAVLYTLSNSSGLFIYTTNFASRAAMDSNFPSGGYTFAIVTQNDGTPTPTLSITGDSYPTNPPPQLSNYDAAQLIDATNDFTVQWAAFTGGDVLDFIQLTVSEPGGATVLSTPGPGQPGALDGTATSHLIPAGTLQTGQTYDASLLFANITTPNIFSYPGAIGTPVYVVNTDTSIRTKSTPMLLVTTAGDAGPAQLSFNADPGRAYDIRAANELTNPTVWTSLVVTNAAGTNVIFTDSAATNLPKRFYQLQEP